MFHPPNGHFNVSVYIIDHIIPLASNWDNPWDKYCEYAAQLYRPSQCTTILSNTYLGFLFLWLTIVDITSPATQIQLPLESTSPFWSRKRMQQFQPAYLITHKARYRTSLMNDTIVVRCSISVLKGSMICWSAEMFVLWRVILFWYSKWGEYVVFN